MYKQKARVKWSVEGDENTKYFHSVMKKRRSKNNMRGLTVDGTWSEEPLEIKRGVREYYESIFMETSCERPRILSDGFQRISEDDVSMLEDQFSEAEVLVAVKNCGSSKAPGPDGFNFHFIKRYWEIIKGDLLNAVGYFWEKGDRSCFACTYDKITWRS